VAIKLPSRRELTLLVPLTRQQHELYRQYLCSLDSSTLEVVMREDTTEAARSNSQSSANLAATRDAVMTKITATSSGSSDQLAATSGSSGAGAGNSNSGSSSADSDWRKLMNLLLQLRKICNHTYLLPDVAPEPYEITEDLVGGSGKLLVGMSNSGIVCFRNSSLCLVPRFADA
jgi:SWI/SNF-related matrix-associated actin-dependent regulator of chromatin subfamily A member 5